MWNEKTITLDLGDEDEGEKKIAYLRVEYERGMKACTRGNPDNWAPPEPPDIHVIDGYWENNESITEKELRNIQLTFWDQIVEEIFP